MKVTRTVRCNINTATRDNLQNLQVPATIDNGADTFMFGSDFRIFEWTDRLANVISFDNSLQLENLLIGSGVLVLLMVHEGIANITQPNSIFRVTQARHHGVDICDRHPKFKSDGKPGWFSMKVGDIEIPFYMHHGLTSPHIRRPTDDELDGCPIIELISDSPWDPTYISGDTFVPGAAASLVVREPSDDGPLHQLLNIRRLHGDFSSPLYDPIYDSMDAFVYNQLDPEVAATSDFFNIETVYDFERTIKLMSKNMRPNRVDHPPDLDKAQRCMRWFPRNIVEKTFRASTQHAKVAALPYRNHFKSRNPVLNCQRLHETYAMDTWFASESAITGETCDQMVYGLVSKLVFSYGMKTESEGPSKLRTFVREIGAPFSLINDNSKMQTGASWSHICNEFNIGTGTTEPHHPWQNPAERKIGTVKTAINRLMDVRIRLATSGSNALFLSACF